MSYEYLSDDEIAAQVLNCTGYKSIDCGYGYEIFLSKEDRKDVGIKASVKFKFDPCNNPSDAWPIITENKIAVLPWNNYEWHSFLSLGGAEGVRFRTIHGSPLRAAMIAFLMMKDGAQ